MISRFFRAGIIVAGAIFLSAFAAQAADLRAPYKSPAFVAPAIFDWTGFYAGFNAGYGFGKSDDAVAVTNPGTWFVGAEPAAVAAAGSASQSPKGFLGGLQVGYNWQWGHFVAGLEADFDYMGLKASTTGTAADPAVPGNFYNISQEIKTTWLGTARPRIGWAFDNFLVYATGGAAVSQIKYTSSHSETTTTGAGSATTNPVKLGWVAGIGAEWAWSQRWSVKAEYLYVKMAGVSTDYGVTSGVLTGSEGGAASLKMNIARLGVNYRF
jgi:outer membrane immunogenic protein